MYSIGDSGIQSILIDILRRMPSSEGRRHALILLLWHDAAGPIIANHVTVRRSHSDGRLSVEVDDIRWMQPIRDASRLIIERINRSLEKLQMPYYAVKQMDIYTAPQQPPSSPAPGKTPPETIRLPESLKKKVAELPESMRWPFIEWYQSVTAAAADAREMSRETSQDPLQDRSPDE